MAAHAIIGSPLWTVRPDPQSSRKEQVAESVETSLGEARFYEHRRAVLGVLDISPEEPTVSGGNGDQHGLCQQFPRPPGLPDPVVLHHVVVVAGGNLSVRR